MNNSFQYTIGSSISLSGIGLHTGCETSITFKPSSENSGIAFIRTDIKNKPIINATPDNVVSTLRGTSIGNGDITIHTIEHILAAISTLEIDNIIVEIDSNEPPIMDGSSKVFCEALLKTDRIKQNSAKDWIIINDPISYVDKENDIELHALPSSKNRITYIMDYNKKIFGHQEFSIDYEKEKLLIDIIPARTFCMVSEIKELLKGNLIKGGNLENALIFQDSKLSDKDKKLIIKEFKISEKLFDNNSIIGNTKLRYKNEPIRHKILDLIGDLALIGRPIKGHIIASRSGHRANIEFVRQINKYFKLEKQTTKLKKEDKFIFSIDEIMKILPHRYPFLLIDRIIELNHGDSVVALKNVTINEPFFQGHFPSEPIMPGVLLLESMAQASGFLVLNSIENPESKLMYFSGINNSRFKKVAKPGDQLIINAKLLKMKLNTCKISCNIKVDDEIICFAEFLSTIVEKGSSNE